jgi:hypothetical protein
MNAMSNDQNRDRGPRRPRAEPEIIPPGRDEHGPAGVFVRIDGQEGVRRVVITRPGWPAIILGLLIVGFIAALAFLAMAGLLLIWIPILVGGILLALLSGAIRRRWRRLRAWWVGGR